MRRAALIVVALVAATAPCAAARAAKSDVVRAGGARFEVLTPTLIRLEYAQDGRFENRPTMTATRARLPVARFAVHRTARSITIQTTALRLTYRLNTGPFTAANLTLRMGRKVIHPTVADDTYNLGGWRRALDLLSGPVELHPGLLTRAGWYVLDDTRTVLLRRGGFSVRPARAGAYQDWYLFSYGSDYARALEDLRALTGPAPLLPRSAFGVWFSRYWPYSENDYHMLLGQFRARRIPLDTLSIDTDFKRELDPALSAVYAPIAGAPGRPYSWNSWEWNSGLFPDPRRFLSWAHSQGLSVTVNIHPSISSHDPRYPAAAALAGDLPSSNGTCQILMADPTGQCHVFNWTNPRQVAAYFGLHQPFANDGVDFFWLDWCCDASSASAPGLTADTWINSLYAAHERARGLRWPAFARAGASYSASLPDDGDGQNGGTGIFAEHRYTIQFTGDTCATWAMLGFEARFSAEEGNVGLPYVSHDIGSFNGQPSAGVCSAQTGILNEHLPDDLYARWVAFGTFEPLDRLHSNHGDRLPWQYSRTADAAAASFLRLREALGPYIYTLARRTYDTGLPITGALYLQWPRQAGAYQHPSEYTFGPNVVVEPVTTAGDPAAATVWIPPGSWVDYFTGRRLHGPSVRTLQVPLDQMPVLVRAGAVIPTQPYAPFTPPAPSRKLILTAYPGARGALMLYDDQGTGFGYTRGRQQWTRITHAERSGRSTVTISAVRGHFAGAPVRRSWEVRLLGVPRAASVSINGHRTRDFVWAAGTLTVSTGARRTNRAVVITAG